MPKVLVTPKVLLTHALTPQFCKLYESMQNHEQRLHNDLASLRFIHLFGWLRIAELGILMKPHTETTLESGARLARSLADRRLVLVRQLPEGAGRALVLSSAGVRFLGQYGFHATSGKSIGYTSGVSWRPPSTWKHDLLAHGVLCELFRQGYEVMPEAEIRRRATSSRKLPDGLVRSPGPRGQWHWLEVESARKSGPHMHRLAAVIAAVAQGTVELCGIRPTHSIVAYFKQALDERMHQLNHQTRVSNAVALASFTDISVTFAECQRKGAAGVASMHLTNVLIAADRTSAILHRLNAGGWIQDAESEVWQASYGHYSAYVWQDSDASGLWSYQVEQDGTTFPAGYADSMQEAKRCAASAISQANIAGSQVRTSNSTVLNWDKHLSDPTNEYRPASPFDHLADQGTE